MNRALSPRVVKCGKRVMYVSNFNLSSRVWGGKAMIISQANGINIGSRESSFKKKKKLGGVPRKTQKVHRDSKRESRYGAQPGGELVGKEREAIKGRDVTTCQGITFHGINGELSDGKKASLVPNNT